jgi:hypothetical protein
MKLGRHIAVGLVMAIGLGWTAAADAAKRVALVIGTDSYKSLPDLNNAVTDAKVTCPQVSYQSLC